MLKILIVTIHCIVRSMVYEVSSMLSQAFDSIFIIIQTKGFDGFFNHRENAFL